MARQKLRNLVSNAHRNRGDAIEGERVIAQARQIGKPLIVPGTSKHRIQEVVLRSNVLCVIDKSFQLKDGAMRLKNSKS